MLGRSIRWTDQYVDCNNILSGWSHFRSVTLVLQGLCSNHTRIAGFMQYAIAGFMLVRAHSYCRVYAPITVLLFVLGEKFKQKGFIHRYLHDERGSCT